MRGKRVHTISMDLTKSFSFVVQKKCPHVTADPSGIWISYHHYSYDEHNIALYDETGHLLKSIEVQCPIRRMASDRNGHLYLASVDAQCVMVFDVATSDIKELAHFDGYPSGLAYCEKDDSLIVCDNECPSYFAYEGGYARLVKFHLSTHECQKRILIPCENRHNCISNVAIGKNESLWTADYINDTVFQMTSDGHVTFSYNGPAEDTVLNPLDICTDKQGRVFVICTSSKCVYVLGETGQHEASLSLDYMPCSVEVHGGRIWIGEMDANKIHVYTYTVK